MEKIKPNTLYGHWSWKNEHFFVLSSLEVGKDIYLIRFNKSKVGKSKVEHLAIVMALDIEETAYTAGRGMHFTGVRRIGLWPMLTAKRNRSWWRTTSNGDKAIAINAYQYQEQLTQHVHLPNGTNELVVLDLDGAAPYWQDIKYIDDDDNWKQTPRRLYDLLVASPYANLFEIRPIETFDEGDFKNVLGNGDAARS